MDKINDSLIEIRFRLTQFEALVISHMSVFMFAGLGGLWIGKHL